jgi:threonine synthase
LKADSAGSVPRFASTRGGAPLVLFSAAIQQGLAPDGGLYVPDRWPNVDLGGMADDLPRIGAGLLEPLMAGDRLGPQLPEIAAEAFDFPAPLVQLTDDGRLSVLELFHGPTAAFKDFGARFLAACLGRLRHGRPRPLTILVATSGDTGGAVAAAFHGRPGIEVAILFPEGLVSPTQQQQLTCWGGNVRTFAVRGTFDDCQRLVKAAFADSALNDRRELTSANSINLGRLLPQCVYYAAASLATWRAHGEKASFVVPSGNLGNAVACAWARRLGMPIDRIVLAHNANRPVPDFLEGGEWRPRRSVATLASAMDVGDPSNFERLRALYPDRAELREVFSADSVDDAAIRARIRADFARHGRVWCPHTATAAEAHARLQPERLRDSRWILVATAHPAKFPEIVEPIVGRGLPVPDTLARLFDRPTECRTIDTGLDALRRALEEDQKDPA